MVPFSVHVLKSSLVRTWGAFFGRYGSFTPAQIAAIPPLLAGENVLLCAATASGKTEAALAPLIEHYLPPARPIPHLTLLYLLPTRALIHDLQNRLAVPLDVLRVSCAVKTHDFNSFDPKRPADILLTTPESLDSLLSAHPRALVDVRAVVIDEIHVFDGTVRGDQMRVVLNRLRQVRVHAFKAGDASSNSIQYVALSATLNQPESVALRYFPNAQVVQVAGKRAMKADYLPLESDTPAPLLHYLNTFRQRGWRKALVFCNTRAEVEHYAAVVRSASTPFGAAIYVHYSNLSRGRRVEIEQAFAHAEAALCFASSTLELGIDIGNIDVVLLMGPPGSVASLVQRAGRGGRRRQDVNVVCVYRTPLEEALFNVLVNAQENTAPALFRPSVAIQQIFSLLKQSPTGALRQRPLQDLLGEVLSESDLTAILGELQASGYLMPGRMGEWRAGERLQQLVDLQSTELAPLSLYSNIQMTSAAQIKILDQHTQNEVARVDRQWLSRDRLTLEGRSLQVNWYDGEALWVSNRPEENAGDYLWYRSTRQVLNYDVTSQLSGQLGLLPGAAPLLPHENGWVLFHWLGDVYGRALFDLMSFRLAVQETNQPGICVWLSEPLQTIPVWTEDYVRRYLGDRFRSYESMLALGAYHHLPPITLRCRAVIEQFDVPRFVQAVAMFSVVKQPENGVELLMSLLSNS
jgi:ATP-dependent Lhr-like helicase